MSTRRMRFCGISGLVGSDSMHCMVKRACARIHQLMLSRTLTRALVRVHTHTHTHARHVPSHPSQRHVLPPITSPCHPRAGLLLPGNAGKDKAEIQMSVAAQLLEGWSVSGCCCRCHSRRRVRCHRRRSHTAFVVACLHTLHSPHEPTA